MEKSTNILVADLNGIEFCMIKYMSLFNSMGIIIKTLGVYRSVNRLIVV